MSSLGPLLVVSGAIVGLLALFVLVAVLLAGFHRRRHAAGRRESPDGPVKDAWAEAGRRLEPPPERHDA